MGKFPLKHFVKWVKLQFGCYKICIKEAALHFFSLTFFSLYNFFSPFYLVKMFILLFYGKIK